MSDSCGNECCLVELVGVGCSVASYLVRGAVEDVHIWIRGELGSCIFAKCVII